MSFSSRNSTSVGSAITDTSGCVFWVRMNNGLKDLIAGATATNNGCNFLSKEQNNRTVLNAVSSETDYVDYGNLSAVDFAETDPFSICIVAKLDNTTGDQFLVAKSLNSGTLQGYYLTQGGGPGGPNIEFILRANTGTNKAHVRASSVIGTSVYHRVYLTYSGSDDVSGMKIYVDGLNKSLTTVQDSLSGSIQGSAPLTFFSRQSGGVPMDGKIAEVAIYNKELSSAEIATIDSDWQTYYNL